jgi:hypothetical protein
MSLRKGENYQKAVAALDSVHQGKMAVRRSTADGDQIAEANAAVGRRWQSEQQKPLDGPRSA